MKQTWEDIDKVPQSSKRTRNTTHFMFQEIERYALIIMQSCYSQRKLVPIHCKGLKNPFLSFNKSFYTEVKKHTKPNILPCSKHMINEAYPISKAL